MTHGEVAAVQSVGVVLVLLGIVGNLLAIFALARCKTTVASVRLYHAFMVCTDLCVVLFSTLALWLRALLHSDIYTLRPDICLVLPFLELSFLAIFPWLLVAMVVQALQGLRMTGTDPGSNFTPGKTLLFCGSAMFLSFLCNMHRLFGFGPPSAGEQSVSSLDRALTSTPSNGSGWSNASDSNFKGSASCVPVSDRYATFVNDAWPWMSVVFSLCLPLALIGAGCGAMLYLLLCCKLQHSGPTSPVPASTPSFASTVSSVFLMSLLTLLTSVPLCGLSFYDPRRYWTDYGEVLDERGGAEGKGAFLTARLVFCVQFSVRWLLTCWFCRLWRVVAGLVCACRKK